MVDNKPYVDSWLHLPRGSYNPRHFIDKLKVIGEASDFDPTGDRAILTLYEETPEGLAIPRQAGFIGGGLLRSATDCTNHGSEAFVGIKPIELWGYQVPVFAEAMTALSRLRPYGGLICAEAGSGKTVMGLEIVRTLGRTTLILVHKEFLMNQWRKRIQEYLPGAKIGYVQQDRCDYHGKDIVIGMIQSLVGRRYPSEFYQWPGVVVVDECHRLGAPTFSQTIHQFPAKVRLGLTATPRRRDGLEAVFFWHVGPIIATLRTKETMKPVVKMVYHNEIATGSYRMRNGKFNLSRWVTDLTELPRRNLVLSRFIIKALRRGRKILALSDRLNHLDTIRSIVSQYCPEGTDIDYYVGGMNEAQRDKSSEADLILGTFAMASEGLDIPALDTLILLTPKGDVEQAVGRIQRVYRGKKMPVVVDLVDSTANIGLSLSKARRRVYIKLDADVR